MANTIYYLSMKVIPRYEDCGSKTYYLADVCRDNAWTVKNSSWPIKKFYIKSNVEYAKTYYEGVEKSHPSYKDAKVVYEVVTEEEVKNDL